MLAPLLHGVAVSWLPMAIKEPMLSCPRTYHGHKEDFSGVLGERLLMHPADHVRPVHHHTLFRGASSDEIDEVGYMPFIIGSESKFPAYASATRLGRRPSLARSCKSWARTSPEQGARDEWRWVSGWAASRSSERGMYVGVRLHQV